MHFLLICFKALATSANSTTPSLALSPPTNTAPSTIRTSGVSSPLPGPTTAVPSARASVTPVTSSADRKKVFGSRSPGIAIPATGHPKEQTLMAELRALDVSKFPLAATMLTRALIELSDLHYRTKNSLQDQTQLSKNIKKSAQHMLSNGKLNASEEDMVKRLCNPSGAMIEIESLQKMVHRKTHNLDRQFVNTLWDNIGCFVKACWA